MNIKKGIKIAVGVLGAIFVIYIIFVLALTTNGFMDYPEFCEKYVEQIDRYKLDTGTYPKSLEVLKKPSWHFRYSSNECNYRLIDDGYSFFTNVDLIGVAYYSSKSKVWTHD